MPELSIVERYRESHHAIARMIAIGMTSQLIRRQTGVSYRRLGLLIEDPSFQELIAHYRKQIDDKWEESVDHYLDLGMSNMIRSETLISEAIDKAEDGETEISLLTLDRISQGRADRFGYSKHATLDVKHDFASMLDKAIARSGKQLEAPSARLIEAQAIPAPPASDPALQEEAGVAHPVRPPRSFTNVLTTQIKRRRA